MKRKEHVRRQKPMQRDKEEKKKEQHWMQQLLKEHVNRRLRDSVLLVLLKKPKYNVWRKRKLRDNVWLKRRLKDRDSPQKKQRGFVSSKKPPLKRKGSVWSKRLL